MQLEFESLQAHQGRRNAIGKRADCKSAIGRFDSDPALQSSLTSRCDVPVWWNRRHAALRTQCLRAWGFNSLYGHQDFAAIEKRQIGGLKPRVIPGSNPGGRTTEMWPSQVEGTALLTRQSERTHPFESDRLRHFEVA